MTTINLPAIQHPLSRMDDPRNRKVLGLSRDGSRVASRQSLTLTKQFQGSASHNSWPSALETYLICKRLRADKQSKEQQFCGCGTNSRRNRNVQSWGPQQAQYSYIREVLICLLFHVSRRDHWVEYQKGLCGYQRPSRGIDTVMSRGGFLRFSRLIVYVFFKGTVSSFVKNVTCEHN